MFLRSPGFGHALPDSKDEAEQLTATAAEPGLGCHVWLTLTVTHFLEQKGVTGRHSSAFGVGWLKAFRCWASAEPVRGRQERRWGQRNSFNSTSTE